jgi:hypothetical protein
MTHDGTPGTPIARSAATFSFPAAWPAAGLTFTGYFHLDPMLRSDTDGAASWELSVHTNPVPVVGCGTVGVP